MSSKSVQANEQHSRPKLTSIDRTSLSVSLRVSKASSRVMIDHFKESILRLTCSCVVMLSSIGAPMVMKVLYILCMQVINKKERERKVSRPKYVRNVK
jgi:hypothetical protein